MKKTWKDLICCGDDGWWSYYQWGNSAWHAKYLATDVRVVADDFMYKSSDFNKTKHSHSIKKKKGSFEPTTRPTIDPVLIFFLRQPQGVFTGARDCNA